MEKGKVNIVLKQISETIVEFDSYFVPRVGETIQVKVAEHLRMGVNLEGVAAWKVDTVRWLVDSTKEEETVVLNVSPTWVEK